MKYIQVCVLGVAAFVLVACGGGGGGGDSIEADRESEGVVEYESGDVVSLAVMNTEATLQLGQTMVSIVELLRNSQSGQLVADCGAFGDSDSKNIRLIDNDENNVVSVGDHVIAHFSKCFVNTMNGNLDGRVEIEIIPGQPGDTGPNGFSLRSALDELMVSDLSDSEVEIQGEINVTYFSDEHVHRVTVGSLAALQYLLHLDGEVFVESLSEFLVSQEFSDYSAQYAIKVSGYVNSSLLESEYEITAEQDVVGYFNMQPFDGLLAITDRKLGQISLSPSLLDGSWEVGHQNTHARYEWSADTEGALWWNAEYCGHVNCTFPGTNSVLHVLRGPETGYDQSSPILVSTDGVELHYQFSKEIDASRLPSEIYLTEVANCCEGEIAVRLEVQGAVLTLVAKSLLRTDTLYRLDNFSVFALDGAQLEISERYLRSKNVIDARISASRSTLVPGEVLELDATESFHSEAEIVGFRWKELTNTGIVFENTLLSRTAISIPVVNEQGIARIELSVTDAIGNVDIKVIDIYLWPSLEDVTYFSFFSEADDPLGKGATDFFTV